MDLILLSLACVAFAMSRTGSRYQYLQTNTFRSKAESVLRNALIAAVNSRPSISRSTFVECAIQSCSSSSTSSVSCPPRCFRVRVRMRSIDALRVILPRYAARCFGFCGGIVFHAFSHVSLTHSQGWHARCACSTHCIYRSSR